MRKAARSGAVFFGDGKVAAAMSRKKNHPKAKAALDIRRAIQMHRAGRLEPAERMYRRILEVDPDDVNALHFLGVAHHQRGCTESAIRHIERAVVLMPDYADAWNNLGNVLKEAARIEAAERAYRRVVALVPSHADALNNLGIVLRAQGKYADAVRAYEECLAQAPAHVEAWQNLGNALAGLDRLGEAVEAYLRVLELRPHDSQGYDALGKTLYRAGRIDEAIRVYDRWLAAEPGNQIAAHMLAACTGEHIPGRASDGYVRELFDGFAGSFDQVLHQLDYRAPALIESVLDREGVAAAGPKLDVADVGCGTGLCGRFLRPLARRLVGVDLSPGMLARARERGEFDELVEAELASWLTQQNAGFDLIVSADTLCYFGELGPVLTAAREALRPDGRLVFTVEHAEEAAAGYRLGPSGRYAHTKEYVEVCLTDGGFTIDGIEPVVLRQEFASDVAGLLVDGRRS